MNLSRVLGTLRKAEYTELAILFFIQGAAMAAWFVPIGAVLDTHGFHAIKPLAFAAAAVASFVSPLMFGAMADRHVSPAKVLRWLALATAVTMTLVGVVIRAAAPAWLVLAVIQIFYFSYSPMLSITSALILARLQDAQKEFGPIRGMATLGWMGGCLLVSALGFDASPLAVFAGAGLWLAVSIFTLFLPRLEVPPSAENLSWHERLGLDALTLLKDRDHRVVFLTTSLFNIPLAAFYPFAPAHLRDLGLQHTSAWMSLAQVTELLAMFSLGWLLLRWRLKWLFVVGLGFGVARFAFSAIGTPPTLLIGVAMHGLSFVLVFVTAQIYLEKRVDPAWRARAQALLSLMNGGFGNLIGYLGTGWWFTVCAGSHANPWPLFWGGLAAIVALVLGYFLIAYRGRPVGQ